VRDVRGIKITVGDTIAYAVRRSSTVNMMIAHVLNVADDYIRVKVDTLTVQTWREYSRPVKLSNRHTIVVLDGVGLGAA
jgi:hypothetical protein